MSKSARSVTCIKQMCVVVVFFLFLDVLVTVPIHVYVQFIFLHFLGLLLSQAL